MQLFWALAPRCLQLHVHIKIKALKLHVDVVVVDRFRSLGCAAIDGSVPPGCAFWQVRGLPFFCLVGPFCFDKQRFLALGYRVSAGSSFSVQRIRLADYGAV